MNNCLPTDNLHDDFLQSEGLRDVMSVLGHAARQEAAGGAAGRPALKLRVVGTSASAKPAIGSLFSSTLGHDNDQLGCGGLRLAFWLSGFHDALIERQRAGEHLTEREEALLTLSRKDFMGIRPSVIRLAIERLDAVVNSADPLAGFVVDGDGTPGPMEIFALETLRDLSRRAQQLLHDEGADAALSMFDKSATVHEPLAIFQLVFTTALSLVEAFASAVSPDAKMLSRLAEALGTEVERI